jgi:hypothetical protein
MSWVGFEPTIPAFERVKTVHALDHVYRVVAWQRVDQIRYNIARRFDTGDVAWFWGSQLQMEVTQIEYRRQLFSMFVYLYSEYIPSFK